MDVHYILYRGTNLAGWAAGCIANHYITQKITDEFPLKHKNTALFHDVNNFLYQQIKLLPYNYENKIFVDVDGKKKDLLTCLNKNESYIYFLDCCPAQNVDMFAMIASQVKKITVIDHNINTIEALDKYNGVIEIDGIKDVSQSVCQLAWKYFYTEKPIPLAIDLLGNYDTSENIDTEEWYDSILPFQYGMRSLSTVNIQDVLDSKSAYLFFNPDKNNARTSVQSIIDKGIAIIAYIKMRNKRVVSQTGFKCKIGIVDSIDENKIEYLENCYTASDYRNNALLFEGTLSKDEYQKTKLFCLTRHNIKDNSYHITLIVPKHNLGIIEADKLCAKLGGGGNKNASSATVTVKYISAKTENDLPTLLLQESVITI